MRAHGTYACYVFGPEGGDSSNGCRCEDCRGAAREQRRMEARRIVPPYVSAGPAREHVKWLAEQGVGLKQIAKISGVSHGALWKLVYGRRMPDGSQKPSKRIRPETASAILAVTPADGADGSRVPAGPVLEQVDRLIAAGVPKVRIAERIGQTRALQLGSSMVTRKAARAIAEMVAELEAGTLVTVKRHRHGDIEIAPESDAAERREQQLRDEARRAEARTTRARHRALERGEEPGEAIVEAVEIDDIDELYNAMADILELRNAETWRADAACRNRPPWMFFPARDDTRTLAAAKKVCGACIVREQCRAANLDQDQGVYGGLSAKERKNLRRHREQVPA